MIHSIFRNDEIIVAVKGVPYTIDQDHPNYNVIVSMLETGCDDDAMLEVLSVQKRATQMFSALSEEEIEETSEGFTYLGNKLPLDITDYLVAALERGSVDPIVNFVRRLYNNPNHDTRTRLFSFMERNKMPIDNDGRFLAFKVVCSDYKDKHTRTIDNTPGVTVPRMSWAEVDTDPTHTCSRGYHACSIDYISSFSSNGDRIVSVAIAPEDVGSIPDDYDGAKLRCRQYEVLADITESYDVDRDDTKLHVSKNAGINPSQVRVKIRSAHDFY
jgi:hypothetical protein